jgi:hypothetical protein
MAFLASVVIPVFGSTPGQSFPGLLSVAEASNCNTIIGENGIEANWTSKVALSAKDFQGNAVAVNFVPNAGIWRPNSGGVGMISPIAPEASGNPRLELGFRGGLSEELTVDFGAATVGLRSAVVTVSRFYIESGRTERGMWKAFNSSMVEVGSGEFLATEPINNNGPGYGTFFVNTASSFRYLVFTAKANISGGTELPGGDDNSDYLVRQIETACVNIFQTCEGKAVGKDGEEANWLASGVVFDLKDFQGNTVASPTFVTNAAAGWRENSGGVGIISPAAPEVTGGPRPEIAFRNGLTETMSVDLGAEIIGLKKVKVSVARFYIEGNRTEVGKWEALDFDGNPTGQSGTFVATEPIGNNGPGIVTFEITPTATFRYLVFTALANTVAGNPVSTGADNSDYLLRDIVIECNDEGDPGGSSDLLCIDPFDDAFPAETHVKHVGGIITEIFEPKGLEIGIVPFTRSPNNDEVGETMFNLNRSVENRLQTELTNVAGNSRRGHLKFMGSGPSPQPIRRADAVITGSKLN